MVNVDRDIKKRWMVFALVNLALVVLIFGALLAGFAAYAAVAQRDAVRDGVKGYAEALASLGVDGIRGAMSGNSAMVMDSPEYRFALYTVSGGSVMIETVDEFLERNDPALGGRVGVNALESVGGHDFETYTAYVASPVGDEGTRYYVKAFAACDNLVAALDDISLNSIPFAVAFIVAAVVFSFVWGYIAITGRRSGTSSP